MSVGELDAHMYKLCVAAQADARVAGRREGVVLLLDDLQYLHAGDPEWLSGFETLCEAALPLPVAYSVPVDLGVATAERRAIPFESIALVTPPPENHRVGEAHGRRLLSVTDVAERHLLRELMSSSDPVSVPWPKSFGRLVERGLILPHDQPYRWWEIHPLVSDALQD